MALSPFPLPPKSAVCSGFLILGLLEGASLRQWWKWDIPVVSLRQPSLPQDGLSDPQSCPLDLLNLFQVNFPQPCHCHGVHTTVSQLTLQQPPLWSPCLLHALSFVGRVTFSKYNLSRLPHPTEKTFEGSSWLLGGNPA